ncbi:MAG: hypothetical protein HY985_06775 [Magnetospirillum sp.]|nr:hypothetical protein [Magnetospirillum sp.]
MARPAPRPRPETRTPFVRLLPALIFVAVLMLSVRVGDIWKGLSAGSSVTVATELQAQPSPNRTQAPSATAVSEPAAKPAAAAVADQANMTPTEMDVLTKLGERRAQIEARERDVEKREALMKAAEDQIERKIAEMRTLQNTIEGLLRQYNDQEDNKMRSLVKIYENMKPKEAAKIFEQLDMAIMLEVVERMKEQRVAPILAEMDPMKARNVTSELAQRRQMPLPKPASGN